MVSMFTPTSTPADIAANNHGVGLMGMFNYSEAHAVFAELAARHPDWADVQVNLAIVIKIIKNRIGIWGGFKEAVICAHIIIRIIGSNIFNILLILGTTSLIKPIALNFQAFETDLWFMLGITALLLPLMLLGKKLGRWQGVTLLLAYTSYVVLVILPEL